MHEDDKLASAIVVYLPVFSASGHVVEGPRLLWAHDSLARSLGAELSSDRDGRMFPLVVLLRAGCVGPSDAIFARLMRQLAAQFDVNELRTEHLVFPVAHWQRAQTAIGVTSGNLGT